MAPSPGRPGNPARGPHVPWRTWRIGMRVSVRRHLPEGGLGDALGYITKLDDSGLEIDTRRGKVWVPAESIYLGKLVPPPPPKRPPRRMRHQ